MGKNFFLQLSFFASHRWSYAIAGEQLERATLDITRGPQFFQTLSIRRQFVTFVFGSSRSRNANEDAIFIPGRKKVRRARR